MKIKKLILLAALGLMASATFTSCEDILGHWEKPTPTVPSSAVEDAKVLGAALEAGATVSVTYTVGTKSYIATFQKGDGDTYTLISNTAAGAGARALTRVIDPASLVPTGDAATVGDKIQLVLVGNKLLLTVKASNDMPLFEAQMNVDGGEVIVINTNMLAIDSAVGSVSVNDESKEIKNPEMKSVNIDIEEELQYAVKYIDGETWGDVAERYKGVDFVKVTTADDGCISVTFSKEIVVETLVATNVPQEQAEAYYTSDCSGAFYLTKTNPYATARAATRGVAPAYVKAEDSVEDIPYYLVPAPVVLSAVTSSQLGWVVGTDGIAYAAKNYLPDGVEAVAMVAYVGSETDHETLKHGLAITLTDVGDSSCAIAEATCSNKNESADAVTDASWMLPSLNQWKKMFGANGGIEDNHVGLNEAITDAGGTALEVESTKYWSSTEHESINNYVWVVGITGATDMGFTYITTGGPAKYRACLAF